MVQGTNAAWDRWRGTQEPLKGLDVSLPAGAKILAVQQKTGQYKFCRKTSLV